MTNRTIPGGLTATQFLREYWQKKPLLIRNAFPGFTGLLDKQALITLSADEDAQSRLVHFQERKWTLDHGPFKRRDFTQLTGKWTLLVQHVNHFLPTAETLLQAFNFIPHARLDDLMVSFAPDGGGVGPHIDSYEVFLLQGAGKRRWQIAEQQDKTLLPNTPLRILKHFQPQQEWLLEPGDMLYLPPNYAHHGVAVGDCMTYSIGFRAPSHQELMHEFLLYLQDQLHIDGLYADPDLTLAQHPAQISAAMIDKVCATLQHIKFNKTHVRDSLGRYLTEPKAHVFFDPPASPLNKRAFITRAQQQGVRLDLKSQLLFTQQGVFMNGDAYPLPGSIPVLLKKLANERKVVFTNLDKTVGEMLYEWYLLGYLFLNK